MSQRFYYDPPNADAASRHRDMCKCKFDCFSDRLSRFGNTTRFGAISTPDWSDIAIELIVKTLSPYYAKIVLTLPILLLAHTNT